MEGSPPAARTRAFRASRMMYPSKKDKKRCGRGCVAARSNLRGKNRAESSEADSALPAFHAERDDGREHVGEGLVVGGPLAPRADVLVADHALHRALHPDGHVEHRADAERSQVRGRKTR